ncbi:MAG TPA: hypothetical protein V6C57_27215, partial [Coleofasciculaceae cyanobacterium]
LPVPFSLTVALPPKCETHLLLGELALYGMAVAGSLPVVLATQSFSVTTDLLELLEALANDFPAEPPPEPTPAKHRVSNTVSTLPKMAPVQFRPVTQPALPPLLRPSEPAKGRRSLDLPMFNLPAAVDTDQGSGLVNDPAADQGAALAHPPAAAPAPPAAPADQQVASSGLPAQSVDIPELTDISAITEETPSPELATASRVDRLPAPPLSDPESSPESSEREDAETARAAELVMEERSPYVPLDDFVDPSVDWENVERLQPLWQRTATVSGKLTSIPEDRTPEDRTPEDSAFRALKLQDRFLERLQALASDTELAEWLHALETPHPADASPDSSADAPSKSIEAAGIFAKRSQVRPIGRDAELAAQEIVVDDEPAHPEEAAIASSSLATLIEEPLPTPQLEVPTGELIAGQTVTVSVKLPATDARVYAKLWTHDRQSRTLLDGPHWLMDFTPDGLGHVISKTPIMVPFGCVEVQFEAIAIEMTSQRESDKVTVIRSVIPPNLSSVPLDELSG